MFYVNLAEFSMAGGVKKIEARLDEVKIKWIYDYDQDEIKYLFDIWEAQLNSTKEKLFFNKNTAIKYAKSQIKNITIRTTEESLNLEKIITMKED